MPKKHYGTYLDEKQIKALRQLSDRTRIPQADLVREAVELLLEKHSGKDASAAA